MKLLHEPADQIRIERRKHALSPLQHGDSRACARREVGELRGDVAAAHQAYACRQSLELDEPLPGDDILLTRAIQRPRPRTATDQPAPSPRPLATWAAVPLAMITRS